jgi:hypothetical protein
VPDDERLGVIGKERRRMAALTDEERIDEAHRAARVSAAGRDLPAPDRDAYGAAWRAHTDTDQGTTQ